MYVKLSLGIYNQLPYRLAALQPGMGTRNIAHREYLHVWHLYVASSHPLNNLRHGHAENVFLLEQKTQVEPNDALFQGKNWAKSPHCKFKQ